MSQRPLDWGYGQDSRYIDKYVNAHLTQVHQTFHKKVDTVSGRVMPTEGSAANVVEIREPRIAVGAMRTTRNSFATGAAATDSSRR